MMMLSSLQERTKGRLIGSDLEIYNISTDTRTIKPGDTFIALRGPNFDGHDFCELAEQKGASALIVENPVQTNAAQLVVEDTTRALGIAGAITRENMQCKVIAITGSNGKTTVKGMLEAIFSNLGPCLATKGNFNNHIGVPLTLLRLEEHHQYAVIEAGTSGKGEIGYLTQLIQPEISLVNNVMLAHAEGFGSLEAIAREKSAIYSSQRLETGVINLEDNFASAYLTLLIDKRCVGFGVVHNENNDHESFEKFSSQLDLMVLASQVTEDLSGHFSFNLKIGDIERSVSLAVPGIHNINNALAAAACAFSAGIDIKDIVSGLENFSGSKGRMQSVASDKCQQLIDDSYNANPGSMRSAIDFIAKAKCSMLIAGDMAELGDSAFREHQLVGEYAKEKGIDRLFAVGPLCKGLIDSYGDNGLWFEDQKSLIQNLNESDLSSASILVKGSRSAKMENIVEFLKKRDGEPQC